MKGGDFVMFKLGTVLLTLSPDILAFLLCDTYLCIDVQARVCSLGLWSMNDVCVTRCVLCSKCSDD
jgi:hypothetical protein